MRRTVLFGFLLAGCPEPAPEHAPPAKQAPAPTPAEEVPEAGAVDHETTYEAMMTEIADDVVSKTKAAAAREFSDFAEAEAALLEVLPENSLKRLDGVMEKAGVDADEMARWMLANPEVTLRVERAFEARLATVEPDLQSIIDQVSKLAPEDDELTGRLREMGYDVGGPEWVEVQDAKILSAVAREAEKAGVRLLIDVRAAWCLPCKEMELTSFRDRAVMELLDEGFVSVKIDVTDPDEALAALQKRLGAESLPHVAVYEPTSGLAKALKRRTGKLPAPSVTFKEFTAAGELAAALGP